jgi:hypothetical protein
MGKLLASLAVGLVVGLLAVAVGLAVRYPPGWKKLHVGMTSGEVSQALAMPIGAPVGGGGRLTITMIQHPPQALAALVHHELRMEFGQDGRLAEVSARRILWPWKEARWKPLWPARSGRAPTLKPVADIRFDLTNPNSSLLSTGIAQGRQDEHQP